MTKYIFIAIYLSFSLPVMAQTDSAKALELGTVAIKLMDSGNFDESIEMLREAQKLDPNRIDYPYEIGYAFYLNKDFVKAIETLAAIKDRDNVSISVYQLLGNAHDLAGDPEIALQVYKEGMEKFPKAGNFYLESGNVAYVNKNYNEAINFWEAGTKVDPNYSSNYFRLAKTFALTDERIWSMLYGELFMNLESGSARTEEMSKLLYQNYRDSYEVQSDSTGEFKMTKRGFEIRIETKKDARKLKKGILPFEGSFATAYAFSGIDFQFNDINSVSIYKARTGLLDFWFNQKKMHKDHPNVLLSRQKKILEVGLFETYTYWLLSKGDPDGFENWILDHQQEFEDFAEWFSNNPIDIEKDDLYSHKDY